jgi:hypothetical protein
VSSASKLMIAKNRFDIFIPQRNLRQGSLLSWSNSKPA